MTALVHRLALPAILAFMALPVLAVNPPAVQWTRKYSALGGAAGYCVEQTGDGGYVAAGFAYTDTGHVQFRYLVKTDSSGNAQWQRVDSEAFHADIRSIVQTSDGGYAITGGGTLGDSGGTYLARLDAAGNQLWQRFLDGHGDAGYSVLQVGGGYAVAEWNGWVSLIRTDSLGNQLWIRNYCKVWPPSASVPLQRTADGGYIIGAKTLIKVDSLGDEQWAKSYDHVFAANSVAQMPDHGYVATGFLQSDSNPPQPRMCLLRTDSFGNLRWIRDYGPGSWGSEGRCVEPAADGGLVVSGRSTQDRIVRTDSSGNVIWSLVLGDVSAQCIRGTTDGGYIITGDGPGFLHLTKLAPDQAR